MQTRRLLASPNQNWSTNCLEPQGISKAPTSRARLAHANQKAQTYKYLLLTCMWTKWNDCTRPPLLSLRVCPSKNGYSQSPNLRFLLGPWYVVLDVGNREVCVNLTPKHINIKKLLVMSAAGLATPWVNELINTNGIISSCTKWHGVEEAAITKSKQYTLHLVNQSPAGPSYFHTPSPGKSRCCGKPRGILPASI